MAYKDMLEYWAEIGHDPVPQVVVCAANKLDDLIICGARHWDDVMRAQTKAIGEGRWWSTEEQGFINQFGTFLTREEAMYIVLRNGQPFDIERNGGSLTQLFSEGLY